jgi:archaellum component FlaC
MKTLIVVVATDIEEELEKLLAEMRADTYITRKMRDRLNRLDERIASSKKRKPVQRRD